MTIEYGVFNDEGCLEAQMYSEAEAQEALRSRYADEPYAYAAPVCPDHEEQPKDECEECAYEYPDD